MILKTLLESIDALEVLGNPGADVLGIASDSRHVKSGWLFVAVPGTRADGAEFITEALSCGAVAVVSENRLDLGRGAVHVQVADARLALAQLANAFYGDLSRKMEVIGVTGTNGKTTTTYMIRNILRAAGRVPGLLGTVAYEIGARTIPASRTTPEATDIHSMFRQMKDHGCDSVVMEVSSHALAFSRVHGIDFRIGIFTNLTRDHLDFHKDMESYYLAKTVFFKSIRPGGECSAVVNTDDPWGQRLVREMDPGLPVLTYGFAEGADVRVLKVSLDIDGTSFKVVSPWGKGWIKLRLLGRFNVLNALAALAAGGLSGVGFGCMVKALENLEAVPGRLELVPNRKGRKIFVDYAHTDDALKNVLTTLREICRGRLIVVFGCGGNRDQGKREKMGRVAAELADYSIITSDNPRREDPATIARDIVVGFGDCKAYEVELDRRKAIEKGVAMMQRKDLLLVAGKGHETYQEFDGAIVPFDDREVVREVAG